MLPTSRDANCFTSDRPVRPCHSLGRMRSNLKLLRSLADGRVFDMPPQPRERYQVAGIKSPHAVWRFNQKTRSLPQGRILRVEVGAATVVHWSLDGWRTAMTQHPATAVSGYISWISPRLNLRRERRLSSRSSGPKRTAGRAPTIKPWSHESGTRSRNEQARAWFLHPRASELRVPPP